MADCVLDVLMPDTCVDGPGVVPCGRPDEGRPEHPDDRRRYRQGCRAGKTKPRDTQRGLDGWPFWGLGGSGGRPAVATLTPAQLERSRRPGARLSRNGDRRMSATTPRWGAVLC
jgi:hypothetical protein